MTFVPYQYNNQTKTKPAAPSTAGQEQDFVPQKFEVDTKSSVSHVAHNIQASKFELNPMMAHAIGVEEEADARKEEKIKVELEKRWEILRAKAEVDGFQAGLEEGKKEAYLAERPRIEAQLGRLESIVSELTGMREKIFQENEHFIMELIAQVMRTILLKEVTQDQDYLRRVLVAILAQTGARQDIRILISEQDRRLIDGLHMLLEKEFGKLSNTSIEASADIAPAGCKVETRFGVVDATLQTQIDNIVQTLRNA